MADFNIELNEDDIQHMSDTNKLNTLLKVAYANHRLLDEHGKIIFGNGSPQAGLCFQVAKHESILKWMVGLVGTAIIAIITAFITIFGHHK